MRSYFLLLFDVKPAFARLGGRGEIRTHGPLARTTVFKTVALNRSATRPYYHAMMSHVHSFFNGFYT